jgi:hypothetical protein
LEQRQEYAAVLNAGRLKRCRIGNAESGTSQQENHRAHAPALARAEHSFGRECLHRREHPCDFLFFEGSVGRVRDFGAFAGT